MAKTYNTIGTFTAGQVLTAAEMNELGENSNNYRVPPMVIARRTTNLTGYTNSAVIPWESVLYDTEAPSDPMWLTGANASRITIQTPGTYAVSFLGYLTASATLSGVQTRFTLNGVANIVMASDGNVASSTAATFSASTQLQLAENDYV
jgi:hypothetical protein